MSIPQTSAQSTGKEASPRVLQESGAPVSTEEQQIWLTQHAQQRMALRDIPFEAVVQALTYGRRTFCRGARIYALGRKEIARFAHFGIDLTPYDGIQVVCVGPSILTVYRNPDFRGLRRRKPRNRHW